ncbi:uncharacterized protein MYCFIDRAFT_149657 [Pseudocercospora fijiensis CIRAD86]|uniref:Cysteine dioxygenase n=1 Tax=Pseudocercospora fijiensis (strain CIRAD86) TaxID=383855 RepID=N1QCD1_PSEFD|nr:uncharacterized protein MYCFIDRAFT_149657 [Pseudocercospora fijiensis CIRAD86]EME89073.1 hypothetical protein MYCFIDRAFT_149657 [Pseudocercospora fijiensis CIRAD86]
MAAKTQRYSSDAGSDAPASLHDSARGSPEPHTTTLDSFHSLVQDINAVLGPCNGIDSADVDVEELKSLMAGYDSVEAEWTRYAFGDSSRAYTRNLVDDCNGKSNLLILVWSAGSHSPIHDHANAHCVMKILQGRLTETIYGWPCEGHTCSSVKMGPQELRVRKETTYATNQVTYMSDRLGLHRVANPDKENIAVSLHLYTPPNAAKHGCHIFDPKTGKKRQVSQCHFFSEFGKLCQ